MDSLLIAFFQTKSNFVWPEAYEKSLQELKYKLTSYPVLTLLEGIDGFVVYCDVLRVRFGCVPMQRIKVVLYASRKLNVHERNIQPMFLK